MNINLGNQGHSQGFTPMIIGEASPYLSPLCGSLSIVDQNSHDDLLDFHLEEQNLATMRQQIEFPAQQFNPELFLEIKEPDSEDKIYKEQDHTQKFQIKTPASITKSNHSKVYCIIEFLVQNDKECDTQLLQIGKPLYENQSNFKFKKLRKTKQQMVKYCMRKAFKFTSDHSRSPKSGKSKKQKLQKCLQNQANIEMPFRKNSSEKTMNIHFLKQTFSNREFVFGYSKFLQQITKIVKEDNDSKIAYLSDTIQKLLSNSETKEIQNIKRLPWTRTILMKTAQLARNLLQYANIDLDHNQIDHLEENDSS